MSRSSARRGQVQPLPALLAVVVVCAGLSLYADVLGDALPGEREPHVADQVADGIEREHTVAGVLDPSRLEAAPGTVPDGYEANLTLTVQGRRWSVGPVPVDGADAATRWVGVRTGAGRVRPGRLEVCVWS